MEYFIKVNAQELEDLKQLLYARMKELDSDKSKVNKVRKKKLADRLEGIYNRVIDMH
ncbi:hypothetical protein [Pedobacter cryoconitis]|uniref:hypothetical protein n=1 Tax=Pedobacter cryoconitis TaxID=188932 RepID=UPI0012FA10AC|nr:hypothetical protein [Pedobacter cryoconitis]